MSQDNAPALEFIPARNPIHRINPGILAKLLAAQQNPLGRSFQSASELLSKCLEDTRIDVDVPPALRDQSAGELGEKTFAEICTFCRDLLQGAGVASDEVLHLHSLNLAQRIHLLRAFSDPDPVLASVQEKVIEVVKGFPRTVNDIEVGRNPGDVLDPYILTATQYLLYDGGFAEGIGATVGHKALMMIEGLLGHLHEDIIGEFRGNIRCPEPRGYHQELLDPYTNPFPGADIVQPPLDAAGVLRFHQVKSKTGSAKGGDARRLGEQLRRLQEYYGGETYYDALIGNTLRGHRSMRGVLRASPQTAVLVGAAAFRELTRSSIGPQLLMRVYHNAFSEASRRTGYSVKSMAKSIVAAFRRRAQETGEEFLDVLLHGAVDGDPQQQDSRIYPRSRH